MVDTTAESSSRPVKAGPLQVCKMVLIVGCLLFGLAGMGVFAWQLNQRAVWKSFTLALATSILLHLNILAMRGKLGEKFTHKRMTKLRRIGIVLSVTSCLLCFSFIVHAHLLNQDFTLSSYYAAAVPSFLSMVWFIQLAREAHEYAQSIPDAENYAVMVEEGAGIV